MAYIEFKNIDKFFGRNHVLRGINMEIEKGQFVTLLGPSGCGKSTLLRCLAGLETIDGGAIFLDGEDITRKDPKDRNIGMVFQHYSLFPNMTVAENIAFGLKLKKTDRAVIEKKVADAIRMVELEGKEDQYPSNLSGGQQQRVALARSIVMEPKVLLLDEPLSAIDAKLRKSLQASIKQITKELGLTAVFVTHDQDEAMVMSDVINLFHDGKIEQSGDPVSVYTRPVSSFAAGFIGNYNLLSVKDFTLVTGKVRQSGKETAIRPETFTISHQPIKNDDEYHFEGIVESNSPRGNVLRYTVNVNGVRIHIDALFRSRVLFEDGSRVYVSVAEKNCIVL
ncbi:MAG: ABC transporter ATP-binding protein [Eubacteriales bacterium]|nr:ABC transporter ATP-binding protein [Eubacteriales bacterium]